MKSLFICALLVGILPAEEISTEILIYDSTPAGIVAAISASKEGRKVVLLTEDKHLGAMRTSGLAMSNAGNEKTFAGLGREFHTRVHTYYTEKYGKGSHQERVSKKGLRFEPSVAKEIFDEWLGETDVTVIREDTITGVTKNGTILSAVTTEGGRTISAAVFIDASYEGDLLKLAGCSYRVGREGTDEYGESLAGVRAPASERGKADEKTQRYTYRVCLTDDPDNRIPITKPANYHRGTYAFYSAQMRSKPPTTLGALIPLNPVPNRKTDTRVGEWVGGSWAFPEASREQRKAIAQEHRDYSQGYLWFLLTDESVPPAIRDQLANWGYPKDEFTDNGHFPDHIYVREARRLVGDYVMTQKDVQEEEHRFKPDSVALGSYRLDVHPVQYIVNPDKGGGITTEGQMPGGIFVKPYEIPYRVLLPKRAEVNNLLVPVCVSASHIALSTLRMEPVYMMLGHASGLAASMALSTKTSVHDLPMDELRKKLVEQHQIISAKPFDDIEENIDP